MSSVAMPAVPMTWPPRGFTLIEVMVVMLLIGIMTGFALLSVGGGPRERLKEEGQRLAALVELHQQEAILRGEPRGIRFTRTGYAILSLNEKDEWQPLAAATTLTRRELPKDIVLGLWVDDRPAELAAAGRLPQVLLLASGEATEFVAVLGFADEQGPDAPLYRIAGDALGRLAAGAVER
ncbi:MAG: type II secretion system minor pseudopilin GspH [Candidatus Competibacter sp.]|nr:type II secretion system minor pseudopilin GspH [Candidatus Competibacter sp.]MDG4585344.1 type II secretion system minor pseudopilin GspH [Candidatus Competibacter sp.]